MNLIKYLLVITLITCTQNAYSQKGIYLKPYIGAGTTDWEGTPWQKSAFGNKDISLVGGVELGLYSHRWHKSIGISTLRIGFAGETTVYNSNNNLLSYFKFTGRQQHILVPLKLGYEIHIGKLSLMPELGAAPAYIVATTSKFKDKETGEVMKDKLTFNSGTIRRFSIFGIAGVNLAYHFNDRLSVTIAPTYYLVVSSNGSRGSGLLNYVGSNHPYALTANVGMVIKL